MVKQDKKQTEEIRICPNCKGYGYLLMKKKYIFVYVDKVNCPVCDGYGRVLHKKIEWIEKVKSVKENDA